MWSIGTRPLFLFDLAMPGLFPDASSGANMVDHVNHMPTILRRKQVEARVGLSRSTIYDRIKAGSFPAPFSLGAKAVGWLQSEVELWIAQRARGTRRTPSPENKSAA